MYKLAIVGTAVSLAAAYHPVNQEMIDDIMAKTTAWTPMALDKNPIAKMSSDEVLGLMCGHNSEDSNEFFASPEIVSVPAAFNWAETNPKAIHPIRD